jgi:hypothetical protein
VNVIITIIIVVHGKLAGPAAVLSALLMLTSCRHHRHRRCARSHGRLRSFCLNKTFYECSRDCTTATDCISKHVEKREKKNVILISEFIITRFLKIVTHQNRNLIREYANVKWNLFESILFFFYFNPLYGFYCKTCKSYHERPSTITFFTFFMDESEKTFITSRLYPKSVVPNLCLVAYL